MRKRYRVLLIAAIVAALVVPVGYALSLESQPSPRPTVIGHTNLSTAPAAAVVASPVIVHTRATSTIASGAAPLSSGREVPGAGKLFLVGTILFGLSALVRKAI